MWAKLQRSWPDNQELPDDFLHPGNELLSLVHEIVARIGSLNVYVMKVDGSNKTRLTMIQRETAGPIGLQTRR